jgi:hypothetical protein
MASKTVIWVDDEPNLVIGEIFDLTNKGYDTTFFDAAGVAFDWFSNNVDAACQASAIVVDVLMPPRGDTRFVSPTGEPVGLLLCKLLKRSFERWPLIQPWLTLYSRSPNTPNLDLAWDFARENDLFLARKNAMTRIAIELLREKRIRL